MPWWGIILIILAALRLLGQIPVGVDAVYDGSFTLRLKIWFFPLLLIPAPKKPKKKNPSNRPAKAKPQTKAKKPKPQPDLSTFLSYVQLAFDLLGDLRQKLVLNLLSLHISFGGDDPAKQAVSYGRAWAVIGTLLPILENTFLIKKRDVAPHIAPKDAHTEFDARVVLSITIHKSLALALHALSGYLKLKTERKVQNHESSSC